MRNIAAGIGLTLCAAGLASGLAEPRSTHRPRTSWPVTVGTARSGEKPGSSIRLMVDGPHARPVFFVARVRGGTVRTLRAGSVALPDTSEPVDSAVAVTPAVFELSPDVRWLQLETRRRDQAVRLRLPGGPEVLWGRLLTLRREGGRWVAMADIIPVEPGGR